MRFPDTRRRVGGAEVLRCWAHFGVVLVVARATARRFPLLQRPVDALDRALGRYTDWRSAQFDRRHGTETFARARLADIGLGPEKTGYEWEGWGYAPIDHVFVHEILRHFPGALEDFSFVDVGSGKGKAVIVAAEYPFRRVIGVELSEELTAIAGRNVEVYARARRMTAPVELVCTDFMAFEIPTVPVVLFFNNPFPSRVAELAIRHVEDAARRRPVPLYVVYRKAPQAVSDRLDASPVLDLVTRTPFWRIYRAAARTPASGVPAECLEEDQKRFRRRKRLSKSS